MARISANAAVRDAADTPPAEAPTRGIGDNGGPPLQVGTSWQLHCWRRAHREAWKTPPREIVLRRLARAQALGMTYREYMLVILDRGIYL